MNQGNNFDNFDANNPQNDDRDKNDFLRNRGGHQYSGAYSSNRGGGNNYGYRRPDNRERGGDTPYFHNSNYNRRPHYDNNGYRENNNYRGHGFNRGNYRNDYNNRGNYSDRRYGNYPPNNSNFENREYQRESNYNRENDEEREMQREKEEIILNFKKKYNKIIEAFKILFVNESLKEEQIIDILQNIKSTPNLTIFEAMNSIYRQVQIIKTLALDKSNRQYGPNSDRIEFEFDQQKSNKNILEKVIKEYKINKLDGKEIQDNTKQDSVINENEEEEEENSEKYWLYIDDFDKRRKLIKDEEGYFNYLPLMNPSGENNKDEDDVYAKNENEISYHALFYKTKMCQECKIDNSSNKNNNKLKAELCPYAHDILKDFRIIYKYTDEDVCKFMILLQDSNLFSFKNYLNYIPMSLKPEFNIDTFKVHKCQLDGDCPNDYHICPYYHKSEGVDEQRRPQTLFGYMGSSGDLCFNQKKKVYCPEKCPCGIFCRFIHNKNEFNYHQEHFRKEFDCKRKKNKYGKCIYINTCYGKHPKEEYNKINIQEEEEKVDLNEIENDEDIDKAKEKINKIFNIAKAFRCRKCQNVESNLCYFTQCKHFVCVKCYKKMYKENKKINSEKKEKKNLLCPFCDKEIISHDVVKVEF